LKKVNEGLHFWHTVKEVQVMHDEAHGLQKKRLDYVTWYSPSGHEVKHFPFDTVLFRLKL
jgi:hypothetical protein